MGGGRGRLLHILQGYRERVLDGRLKERAGAVKAALSLSLGRRLGRINQLIKRERARI
jgi:hypothetical protein